MDENNRRAAIIQYLQKSMEEYFNNSCRQFQTDVETHGSEIWNELRCAIDEVLKSVLKVQDKNQKGDIQYIAFSFLRSSLYQNNLEFNIEAKPLMTVFIWIIRRLPGVSTHIFTGKIF